MTTALGLGLAAYIAVLVTGDIYLILVHIFKASGKLARERLELGKSSAEQKQPLVCVQLPVQNEASMVVRAIDALCALNWPKERLEIPVLDDASTDDTRRLAAERISVWSREDIKVFLHCRVDRSEYKAELLREALQLAKAKYVAILEVD